ncbi:MAG: ATP-binding protein [Candidatus Eisenbacteria bacterium]
MTDTPTPRMDPVERRAWWLWGLTFALLLALTATIPVLYLPLLRLLGAEERAQLWIRDGYDAFIGLGGLVVLFMLYTVIKQRELNRMRSRLHEDRHELEDSRTRLSEVSALFSVATTLNLQLRLEVVLEIIVRRVVSTLRAQQASVMIYNPETGVLETRASYGLESEFARHARTKMGEGIAGWVAETQQSLLLGPDERDDTFRRHYKHNRNITSALSLPLRVGDRCVGVLNVNRINHPQSFQEHHRETLRLFAEHVGSVIERAEMVERLAARTQALEATNLHLNELHRLKDVFLSTASHELKTPLTAVIAYAELLEVNEGKLPPERQAEFLRRLRNEARQLLGLIDDILDLSRLETGKLVLERVPSSVNTVAQAALDTTQSMAEKYEVTVTSTLESGLPQMELDEVKMRQVVVNLIANAVKFSPPGGRVTVATRRDGDFVVVEVTDQGPGIPPDAATHIFSLFGQGVRLGKPSRTGGLGIGLHLVKRLAELHGGHVGVNSPESGGSTFWVRLPLTGVPLAEPIRAAA